MKLSNQLPLPVDQIRAWEALNDIATLKAGSPGCEAFEQTGDNKFELIILATIGPVRARFKERKGAGQSRGSASYRKRTWLSRPGYSGTT